MQSTGGEGKEATKPGFNFLVFILCGPFHTRNFYFEIPFQNFARLLKQVSSVKGATTQHVLCCEIEFRK